MYFEVRNQTSIVKCFWIVPFFKYFQDEFAKPFFTKEDRCVEAIGTGHGNTMDSGKL